MYKDYGITFWGVHRVGKAIKKALRDKKGFSLVRLGGGEIKSLCHDIYIPTAVINEKYQYDYAGVRLPDEKMRKDLGWAVKNADVAGVLPYWRAPELKKIFGHLNITPKVICSAYINWILHDEGKGLLYDHKPLDAFLIGRRAEEALVNAEEFGLNIVGYTEVEDFYDYPKAIKRVSKEKVNLVLVSAGIPAVVICSEIARKLGKVAIDFGHVLDRIIDLDFGSHNLLEQKKKWRSNKK